MPIRLSPSGPYIPSAYTGGPVAQRQNPDAAQLVTPAAGVVVLQQSMALQPGQGLSILACCRGENQDDMADGTLNPAVQISINGGAFVTLDQGAEGALATRSCEIVIDTALVPAPALLVAAVVVVRLLVTVAGATFDVGLRSFGGCSLKIETVDLADFSFAIATP